ncbi:MAG: bifunctional isocitrate dehydrogenase kinase/phosphatase [Chloroflexi bacterium]|nr:bifunctional isocitrate dehydrogenase kinase/phosphatase [Chloroflexota bacterium]
MHKAFVGHQAEFQAYTHQGRVLFEQRDWAGAQENARARLDLYRRVIDRIEATIREILEDRVQSRLVWASAKAVYSGLIVHQEAWEQAETFFNSVTRRIFTTVGGG